MLDQLNYRRVPRESENLVPVGNREIPRKATRSMASLLFCRRWSNLVFHRLPDVWGCTKGLLNTAYSRAVDSITRNRQQPHQHRLLQTTYSD